MQVNMTVVIQAVQFMISYYFLYNFLFVPAHKILLEEEREKANLDNAIKQGNAEVKELKLKNKTRFSDLKAKIFQLIPTGKSSRFVVDKQLQDSSEQKVTSIEKTEDVKQFLINKLSDVQK